MGSDCTTFIFIILYVLKLYNLIDNVFFKFLVKYLKYDDCDLCIRPGYMD